MTESYVIRLYVASTGEAVMHKDYHYLGNVYEYKTLKGAKIALTHLLKSGVYSVGEVCKSEPYFYHRILDVVFEKGKWT